MRGDFYGIFARITMWRAEYGNEDFVQKGGRYTRFARYDRRGARYDIYLSEVDGVGSGL